MIRLASPKHLSPWLTEKGPEGDVVVSCRGRLARNLENAPFPEHARAGDLKMIWQTVSSALSAAPLFHNGHALPLKDRPPLERDLFCERQWISRQQSQWGGERGMVLDASLSVSVMINEEDHLRLAVVLPGLDFTGLWKKLDALDNDLGARLAWAFHPTWGFLAACPTNCGTGLRVSALVHLTALRLLGRLEAVLRAVTRLGLLTRGFYGEGSAEMGDMFQISNATCMGRGEDTLIRHVQRVVRRVVAQEKAAREELLSKGRLWETEDTVHRSFAILQAARVLTVEESLFYVSRVRLGLCLGMSLPVTLAQIQKIMILAQPAHVRQWAGADYFPEGESVYRADMIRNTIANKS